MTSRWVILLACVLTVAPMTALADPGIERQITALSERLTAAPQSPLLLIMRADLERRVGRWDAAQDDLNLAEAIAGETGVTQLIRARILLDRGDDAAAGRLIEATAPDMQRREAAIAYALLGQLHQEAGRMDEALSAYDASLLRVDTIETHMARGRLLVSLGRSARAIDAYESALQAMGDVATLRVELVEVLLRSGANDRAVHHATLLVESARAPSRFLLLRARAYEGRGDRSRAHADREAALADAERVLHRRNSATAQLSRARALAALGRGAEAIADLEQVLRRAPRLDEARVLLHALRTGGAR